MLRCRWCPLSLWALELASDLSSDGISGIADSYMAQTDSRGNVIRSNPFQDAQTAALIQNRRAQLQNSANPATAAWNSKQHPSFLSQINFTD